MGFDQEESASLREGRIRRPEWVAHVLDEPATSGGEQPSSPHAVLLHLPRGERVALSETATRIWQLIVEGREAGVRVSDIVDILAGEYSVDPSIVEHDAALLVSQLLAGEWAEFLPDSGD